MAKEAGNETCRMRMEGEISCCKVESVISIDDRGQMVLPKSVRDMAKIRAGDKLAVVTWEKDGEVCCISLIRVDDLAEMVKGMLGPLMKDMMGK